MKIESSLRKYYSEEVKEASSTVVLGEPRENILTLLENVLTKSQKFLRKI